MLHIKLNTASAPQLGLCALLRRTSDTHPPATSCTKEYFL